MNIQISSWIEKNFPAPIQVRISKAMATQGLEKAEDWPLIMLVAYKLQVEPVEVFCSALQHTEKRMNVVEMRMWYNDCLEDGHQYPEEVNDFCLDVLSGKIALHSIKPVCPQDPEFWRKTYEKWCNR